jgi:hypothetical protein
VAVANCDVSVVGHTQTDRDEGLRNRPVLLGRDDQDLGLVVRKVRHENESGRTIALNVELDASETGKRNRDGFSWRSDDDHPAITDRDHALRRASNGHQGFAGLQEGHDVVVEFVVSAIDRCTSWCGDRIRPEPTFLGDTSADP